MLPPRDRPPDGPLTKRAPAGSSPHRRHGLSGTCPRAGMARGGTGAHARSTTTEGSHTMHDAATAAMLVLCDQAGHYYLLPRQAVERARVPDERRAAIERVLTGEDVVGFGALIEERPARLATAGAGLLSGLTVRGIIIDWQ